MASQLMLQQGNYLGDKAVYIYWRHLRVGFLVERAKTLDYLASALTVADNTMQGVAHFMHVWLVTTEQHQADLPVDDNGGERLINFVRDGCSQLAESRRAVDMRKLRLRQL